MPLLTFRRILNYRDVLPEISDGVHRNLDTQAPAPH